MTDLLSKLFDKVLYIVNPPLGALWDYAGESIKDLLGLDDLIEKFFALFEFLLPILHRYVINLIFDESVQLCKATGELFISAFERNFGNVNDLSILSFLFGLIIFIFVIKLCVHIISGIIAMV